MGYVMRPLQWRAALMIVGAGLVIAWVVASGGASYLIQVDYSWTGDMLEGAEVVIDGEVVGTLEPIGRQRVTGFRVERGEHVVSVRSADCRGRPERVESGPSTRRIVFMADIQEALAADGYRCVVTLHD
jgi:hypothetical protein